MEEFKVPMGLPKSRTDNTEILKESAVEKKETQLPDDVKKKPEIKSKPKPQIECPYTEPLWSGTPNNQGIEYKFEVLKSGSIVEEFKNLQTRPYWIFGRLPENDILMAHPTISRYHAVLQYYPKILEKNTSKEDDNCKSSMEPGWYIYDIESTHGTFLNKLRIPSRTYIRMKVGHMLKLGASTRYFILHGPGSDEEPESELTVTELKNLRDQKKEEKRKYDEMQQEMREKEGISWGMAEDADEETDLSINPYATTNNEELFLDDPKKTLRGFFEREGLDLDYKCDEMSPGTFVCRIELPLDDSNGKPIIAEICHKGKKKECVVQCALEACRILDRHGVLRQANHEPLKRKVKTSDSDDDDDFLDRTGDIARKKLRKENLNQNSALSYDTLILQEQEIAQNISRVEDNILKYQENTKRLKEINDQYGEDLDDFMENLSEKTVSVDKTEIRKLRVEHQRLLMEQQKILKLIKIAKPIDILTPITTTKTDYSDANKNKLTLPLFGKRNKYKFTTIPRTKTKSEICDQMENKSEDDDNTNKILEATSSNSNITDRINPIKNMEINSDLVNIPDEVMIDKVVIEQEVSKSKKCELPNKKIIKEQVALEKHESKSQKSELPNEGTEDQVKQDNKISKDNISSIQSEDKTNTVEQEDILNSKKRRNRPRIRNRRENVDIDDFAEFEDSDKHSEWIPPTNQTGDGMTILNSKFGY